MTDNQIAVELDADCVWALRQIVDTTGESTHTILRVAISQVWGKFAAKERLFRKTAMDDPSATLVFHHANVVDLVDYR